MSISPSRFFWYSLNQHSRNPRCGGWMGLASPTHFWATWWVQTPPTQTKNNTHQYWKSTRNSPLRERERGTKGWPATPALLQCFFVVNDKARAAISRLPVWKGTATTRNGLARTEMKAISSPGWLLGFKQPKVSAEDQTLATALPSVRRPPGASRPGAALGWAHEGSGEAAAWLCLTLLFVAKTWIILNSTQTSEKKT